MNDKQSDVVQATADALAARDKLSRDVAILQERLDPKLLARDAKERLTDTGASVAESAKRNPAPFAGAAAVLALLVIRKPVARLFRRRKNTYSDGKAVAVTSNPKQSKEGSA